MKETRDLLSNLATKTDHLTTLMSGKIGEKRSWDGFTQRRRSAFDSTWDSVKHSMRRGVHFFVNYNKFYRFETIKFQIIS